MKTALIQRAVRKTVAVFTLTGAVLFAGQSMINLEVQPGGVPKENANNVDVELTAFGLPPITPGSVDGAISGSMEFGNMLAPLLNNADNLGGNVPAAPSTSTSRTITINSGGRTRSAIVKVPAFSAGQSLPVLFAFPGWKGPPAEMADYSKLHTTGMGRQALVVYMKGINDAWEGAPYAQTRDGEDVQFVRDMLARLKREYSVDSSRVYAAGLSNGGGFVNKLACRAPGLLAGGVSVAGAYYTNTTIGCSGGVPMLFIHGTNDGTVTINGGVRHGTSYKSLNSVVDEWKIRNTCFSANTSTVGNVVKQKHNCTYPLEYWKVNGGTHTWFPNSPSASQATWSFLASTHR